MDMTRHELQQLEAIALKAINDAMKGTKYTCRYAGGTYGSKAVLRFEVLDAPKPGQTPEQATEAKEREEWRRACGLFGLKPEDYGKEFAYRGSTYALVSIHPERPMYPFVAKVVGGRRTEGKRFKFPRDILLRARVLNK